MSGCTTHHICQCKQVELAKANFDVTYLTGELKQMTSERDEWIERCRLVGRRETAAKEECHRLRVQDGELIGWLRNTLRQVQWINGMCPICDQTPARGHAPDCPIGAALEVQE